MFSKWTNKDSADEGFSFRKFLSELFYEDPDNPKSKGFLKRIPLAYKLTGWYTIFLVLMLILLSVFIMQFTHLWEDSELRSELQSSVISTADNLNRYRPYADGVFTVIYTEDGVAVKGAVPDGFPPESMLSPHRITEITVKNATYYYYDAPIADQAFHGWVRGILPVTAISRKTNVMILAWLFGGLIFLVIGTLGGYWLVKRGLKPIRNITETAAEIGRNRDLSRRIEGTPSTNDEIYALSQTFNTMLDSLEHSSQRERQFSSDVSHELRTPIAVIQAESDYGRSYISSIDEAKESFEHIFKQSRFMTSLVTQMLETARLATTTIEFLPYDLTKLLEETGESYSRISHDKNITLSYDIAPDLVSLGNTTLIKRAVGNLLDNALKFTNNAISLKAFKKADGIHVIVSDNGDGIAPEEITKIWDRLYQSDTSRSKSYSVGLGLGLYFVNSVVKLHNGTASVTSEEGNTVFTLILPSA